MELHERLSSISSKEDFADFVAELLDDLRQNPGSWENGTLERFLFAMERWVREMDSYYKNTGQAIPENRTWKLFANVLYAAKIYE